MLPTTTERLYPHLNRPDPDRHTDMTSSPMLGPVKPWPCGSGGLGGPLGASWDGVGLELSPADCSEETMESKQG